MSAAEATPVFIHSWWRTASTYLRVKLRENESLCCYAEPLHEVVGMLTRQIVRAPADRARTQALHHPEMKRGYFAEYEPLLERGIPFHKSLSYDRYFLGPEERDAQLETYLAALIESARGRGKRPVLAFCRSALRSAWMKRRFGGLHAALLREPREQWGSMLEQHGQGGTYFLAGVLAIAARLRARAPRAFAHLQCRLPDHRADSYNPHELGFYIELAKKTREYDLYAVFVLLWLASTLQMLSVADLALDASRLSADPSARRAAEERLAAQGLPVDLSDMTTPKHPRSPLAPEAMESIEFAAARALARNARELVIADEPAIARHLDDLAPRSRRLTELCLHARRAQGGGLRSPPAGETADPAG
jgi:hypothetical protein